MHRLFRTCRVKRVNERKEFFRIPLDFIVTAVREKHGQIEVTRLAEAVEYRKTLAILEEERRAAKVFLYSTASARRSSGIQEDFGHLGRGAPRGREPRGPTR